MFASFKLSSLKPGQEGATNRGTRRSWRTDFSQNDEDGDEDFPGDDDEEVEGERYAQVDEERERETE